MSCFSVVILSNKSPVNRRLMKWNFVSSCLIHLLHVAPIWDVLNFRKVRSRILFQSTRMNSMIPALVNRHPICASCTRTANNSIYTEFKSLSKRSLKILKYTVVLLKYTVVLKEVESLYRGKGASLVKLVVFKCSLQCRMNYLNKVFLSFDWVVSRKYV